LISVAFYKNCCWKCYRYFSNAVVEFRLSRICSFRVIKVVRLIRKRIHFDKKNKTNLLSDLIKDLFQPLFSTRNCKMASSNFFLYFIAVEKLSIFWHCWVFCNFCEIAQKPEFFKGLRAGSGHRLQQTGGGSTQSSNLIFTSASGRIQET